MFKALVIKELRESAGVIALTALGAAFVLASLTGVSLVPIGIVNPNGFPFLNDSFTFFMGLVIGGLAVALGLKQTAAESAHGTYHFLLHRPVSRRVIFGTKLVVGTTTVLVLGGLMILLYARWASGEGHSGTPFYWSMTLPAWELLVSLALVYLGAFLSGIRPSRWFGSRLAPLVAGGAAVMFLSALWWWWLYFAVAILFAVIGLAAIFQYVDSRDY